VQHFGVALPAQSLSFPQFFWQRFARTHTFCVDAGFAAQQISPLPVLLLPVLKKRGNLDRRRITSSVSEAAIS
jgi:hypothetical protein